MTWWNYRVVRDVRVDPDGEEVATYDIHEVYYHDDGTIRGWSKDPIAPHGESWAECGDDHARMGRALTLPVVDVSTGEPREMTHP